MTAADGRDGAVDPKYAVAFNDVKAAYDGSIVTCNEAGQLQANMHAVLGNSHAAGVGRAQPGLRRRHRPLRVRV